MKPLSRSQKAIRALLCVFACAVAVAGPTLSTQEELNTMGPRDAVALRLALDPAVDATEVAISLNNGSVRLTGKVESWLARNRAAHLAAGVRGVDEVENRLEVVGVTEMSDRQMRQSVRSALADHPGTATFDIEINVAAGVVELIGQVNSLAESALVREVAGQIRGIREVRDQLAVAPVSDRTDAGIRDEIEQALRWNSLVRADRIEVSVADGVVTLEGEVNSLLEKGLAIEASSVPGVISVEATPLAVVPIGEVTPQPDTLPLSAATLTAAIESSFQRDPQLSNADLQVDVDADGRVTLSGTVDRLALAERAVALAAQTRSVWRVENMIQVERGDAPDELLEEHIQAAFSRDPVMADTAIRATVADGRATLEGNVANNYQRKHAASLAGRIPGIHEIVNAVEVEGSVSAVARVNSEGNEVFPTPERSDRQIFAAIEEGLWWSPYVDRSDVAISVEGGVAVLRGKTSSLAQAEAAIEIAYLGGAVQVVNELEVASN